MKKLYLQTYGCQMNQYDSERIAQILSRMDYERTEHIETADLILLNTCSVRDKAEQKVTARSGDGKMKERREGVIIGVGGCVAQQEGANLLRRMPHVDLVFGTHNIQKLPQMLEQVRRSQSRPVEIAFYRDPSYMDDPEGRTRVEGAKAFVTSCKDAIKSAASAPRLAGEKSAGRARRFLPRSNP
jgi:tRNA-2-methylthio-N6-dimethylallyladenosine synthase